MAHSLHDHAGAPPASTAPSCSSWAATSSTDHLHMQAPPPPSNFFRQLFSNECDADEGGYEDLLQLPPPDVSPFEMLSSPKVLHPQHMENVDNSSQSQNRAGDFVDMPSTAGEDFPLDCYLKNNNGSSNGSQDGTTALPSNRPHTLEFVTPPGSVSSCSSILTFHSNTTGKLPDMTASAQMLLQDQTSPSENSYPFDSPSEPPSSADAHIKKSTEEHQTSLVSNKKVKTAQRSEQSCGAATESTKVQAAVSKVQSSRSKEKLGERISALQQLVSPFGKTDTASVLSEAIGYIKFLQEQVQVLSSPYMKPSMLSSSHQDVGRESMSDLRSRGLCLVPVSCTISVANNHNFNIGADYWASTPSGTIRAAVGGGGGGATSSATARHSPIS